MGILRTKIRKWISGSEIAIAKVDDEAARLALAYDFAKDKIVEQLDDSSQWVLNEGGDPSDTNDWTVTTHPGIRIDSNGAVSVGDLDGDARGSNSVTVQTLRSSVDQVASGASAVAIGQSSKSSGSFSVAIGLNSSSTGYAAISITGLAGGNYSVSFGAFSESNGLSSIAIGDTAKSNKIKGIAIGFNAYANGDYSSSFGHYAKTQVDKTTELGYWSGSSTRGGAVRIHGITGMVGFTIQDRATAYTDGGAGAGSEADNTIMRGGYSIRRDGDDIYLDLNIAGTIKTLSLGTAT